MDNLPALDALLSALDGLSRARWERGVSELGIGGREQTSQRVRFELHRGDVGGALFEVLRARLEVRLPHAPSGMPQASITSGSKSDQVMAAAISALSARRATAYLGVELPNWRTSIFGRAEPLSRAEAWEFLGKAEELPRPIAWERLYTGWDRHPRLSQTQFGDGASLSFRDEAGRDHQFRADPHSVLSTLWMWADNLSRSFNWPRSQAAWFLLTGEDPTLLPLVISGDSGLGGVLTTTLTVTTFAYGGEESVMAAVASARHQLFGRRRGPLALARHVMTEFVDDQRERQRLKWPELWRRWNKFAPPQWRLFEGRLRYPNWQAMLDAYRREKRARRKADEREDAVRSRHATRETVRSRRRKPGISASRARKPNHDS